MKARLLSLCAVAVAASTLSPAPAGAAGGWAQVSGFFNSNTTIPSLIADGPDVLVAWRLDTSGTTQELDAQRFKSSSATVYQPDGPRLISYAGYVGVSNPALFYGPGNAVEVAFQGTRSINAGETVTGFLIAGRNPDGTFAVPTVAGAPYSGDDDAISLADGSPLLVSNIAGTISVLHGVDPTSHGINAQAALGGCCGYHPALGRDSQGRVWLAWYSNATNNTGLYVQQLDPATGAPTGAVQKAPSSEAVSNNNFDIAMACAATCRVVYGAPAPDPTKLVSWAPGEAAPTTIFTQTGLVNLGRVVTAAYRGDGKLWVAWFDSKSYRYTLGDATGKGGTVQDIGVPTGTADGGYALSSLAVGNDLVLATNFIGVAQPNAYAIWVNRVGPASTPPPPAPAPGPRDTTVTTGPGGKGFRIQVQYRVTVPCSNPCRAHAEIRTRSGPRRYRTTNPRLPGDGPVVLGTRGAVKLPTGRKVRFFMTVTKPALLRTPFHTEGGFRVAETRLRVWLSTPHGQVLTVRDGRIKVSIARIESGALPGLRGIL